MSQNGQDDGFTNITDVVRELGTRWSNGIADIDAEKTAMSVVNQVLNKKFVLSSSVQICDCKKRK